MNAQTISYSAKKKSEAVRLERELENDINQLLNRVYQGKHNLRSDLDKKNRILLICVKTK